MSLKGQLVRCGSEVQGKTDHFYPPDRSHGWLHEKAFTPLQLVGEKESVPLSQRAWRADIQKDQARVVGIFSNTEAVKQDVASPGGIRHRLDAGKAHSHHTPGTASKPKKFWHPEAQSQLLSTCALQVLLLISCKICWH